MLDITTDIWSCSHGPLSHHWFLFCCKVVDNMLLFDCLFRLLSRGGSRRSVGLVLYRGVQYTTPLPCTRSGPLSLPPQITAGPYSMPTARRDWADPNLWWPLYPSSSVCVCVCVRVCVCACVHMCMLCGVCVHGFVCSNSLHSAALKGHRDH